MSATKMKNSFFPAFICCMVANVLAGQCGISFETTMLPMVVTDCDASGGEHVSWETPLYKVSPGCGAPKLVQISGPPLGTESPTGTFDVTYRAMAVDKSSLKLVQEDVSFKLTVLPKDITPPVIAQMGSQVLKNTRSIPDYTKLISVKDDCTPTNELVIIQKPLPGTLSETTITTIEILASDKSGNQTSSNFALTIQQQ